MVAMGWSSSAFAAASNTFWSGMISPVMDTGDGIGFKGGVGSGDLGRQSECCHCRMGDSCSDEFKAI